MALMKNPLVLFRIARASLRLVKAPDRLDEVIAIADELGESQAFEAILAYVQGLPGGPAALAARPRREPRPHATIPRRPPCTSSTPGPYWRAPTLRA